MILNIIKLIFILIIAPFLMGIIPAYFLEIEKRMLSTIYIMGFLCQLALFQLVTIPVIFINPYNFTVVVVTYTILMIASCVGAIILMSIRVKKFGNPVKEIIENHRPLSKENGILWTIAIALILFQMIMFVAIQSFDGDDAYYVVQSVLTYETNTMYSIKPYTGLTTSIDLRHALAATPMWLAYISRMTNIHPTILAHSIIGLFLIPILYMLYYRCGYLVLKKDHKRLPVFMIFLSIMYIFGGVSIYTPSTFMITRTWQGKAMLANIVFIAITWLLLSIYETENMEKEMRIGYWAMLFVTNIVAAMCSTSSVFLVAIFVGFSGLVMSIYKKDIQVALRLMVTCMPLVAYGAMYMLW